MTRISGLNTPEKAYSKSLYVARKSGFNMSTPKNDIAITSNRHPLMRMTSFNSVFLIK
jgi:hypothetical protein